MVDQPKLYDLNKEKDAIKTEVKSRIMEEVKKNPSYDLLEIIHETLYQERERLRKYAEMYKNPKQDKVFFKKLAKKLVSPSDGQRIDLLDQIIQHYLDEITGNFNPALYKVATHLIPGGLTFMLNTISPWHFLKSLKSFKNFKNFKNLLEIPSIENTLILSGNTERLRKIKEKGDVLIYVPEHQSNLDSPLRRGGGWA